MVDQTMKSDQGVMLDLESFSLSESTALVVSAAVVKFTMQPNGPVFDVERVWRPELVAQLLKGRRVDTDTQKFWMDQTLQAQQNLYGERVGPCVFLRELTVVCHELNVWSNGICFDLCNIVQMAEQFGEPRPWGYRAAHDARTIYQWAPRYRESEGHVELFQKHVPLDDCKLQIWRLWEHWNFTS